MKSTLTKEFGILNATIFEDQFSTINPSTSYYLSMGRSVPWANSTTGTLDDSVIPTPTDSVLNKLDVLRNAFFLKRITSSDLHPVIPRVDWVINQVYVPYDHTTDLFAKRVETQIASGNVNVSMSLANTVVANGINFNLASPSVSVGTIIKIGEESKEVIRVNTAGDFLQVNTNFTSAYTRANIFKVSTSTLGYVNKFYVRNNADQVFKCLFNNNNALSTVSPSIAIGGQLPSNPYIATSDGYKWKYMYTIPAGLKQRFFTADFMPIASPQEKVVTDNAVDGRIDIVQILSGGSGYYNGSTTTNYSPTSNVINVVGDGTGAQLTADVTNGVITKINILNGGSGYTYATITVNDPLISLVNTAASLRAVISPSGGHGSSLEYELGASYRMMSVDFDSDINGLLPVSNSGNDDFRQIALVQNPRLDSNNGIAFGTTGYNLCTKIYVNDVTGGTFTPDSTVYVGASYAAATFTATVVFYDSTNKILYVNLTVGDTSDLLNKTIVQKDTAIQGKIFQVDLPDINTLSGQILYIENRSKIIRNPDQSESTRILFAF
jgi:hypothetical protein